MRVPRLPKKHVFPGGFTVAIELVDAELAEGKSTPETLGEYGTLTTSTGFITLWRGLTPRQRWRVLMHEMLHALADAQRHAETRAGYSE